MVNCFRSLHGMIVVNFFIENNNSISFNRQNKRQGWKNLAMGFGIIVCLNSSMARHEGAQKSHFGTKGFFHFHYEQDK